MQVNFSKFKKVFLGKSLGIALSRRGNSDPHVLISFLVEDDEAWHLFDEGGQISSYWMPEFVSLMNEAMKWIEDNCQKEDLVNGISYGWKFV